MAFGRPPLGAFRARSGSRSAWPRSTRRTRRPRSRSRGAQNDPLGHCESLVHQQGVPLAAHPPSGDDTVSQLPIGHDHPLGTDVTVSQPSLSATPVPVQVPVHRPMSTHFPLAQLLSATQRQAVDGRLSTGTGVSVVKHPVPPPAPTHATELRGATQPLDCAVPLPVHLDRHEVAHLPLAH